MRLYKFFSKINMIAGCNKVQVADNDMPRTASITTYCAYKIKVMNFGMTNAPSSFVTIIDSVSGLLLGS